jgi:hypothetical protein
MRQILIRYLVVVALSAVGVVALDYWNFPLSPINYLNRLYPVDLTVRIPEATAERLQAWLEAEGGAELSVRDAGGRELQRQATDSNGRLRVYLHSGSYLVLGALAALQEDGQVVFHETRGPLGLEVRGRKVSGIVELVPSRRTEPLRVAAYVEKQLERGEYDRALKVLQQRGRSAGSPEVSERLGRIRQRLDEGAVQLRTLQQLGPASYNSSIVVLGRLEQIVADLTHREEGVTVHFGGERLDPAKRRQNMAEARDAILAARLDVAEQALRARSFFEALAEYRGALSDPELWRPGQEAPPEIQSRVDAYEDAHQALTDKVQTELLAWLGEGVDAYNAGDLDASQVKLIQVLRALRRLEGELEMPEVQESAGGYLRDIDSIVRARGLEKEERWAEALEAYLAVTNDNPLVRQGIVEARSRQGQGIPAPKEPPPAEAGALPSDL